MKKLTGKICALFAAVAIAAGVMMFPVQAAPSMEAQALAAQAAYDATNKAVLAGSTDVVAAATGAVQDAYQHAFTRGLTAADCKDAADQAVILVQKSMSVIAPMPVPEPTQVAPVVEDDYTDDLQLLATVIYLEAGNQGQIGQIAVANVILNRVRSELFPNTIEDVIYQKNQFMDRDNPRLVNALANPSYVPQFSYDAAWKALQGVDYVGESVYFMRKDLHEGIVIGDHVFFGSLK